MGNHAQLGKNIKKVRIKNGLTQAQIAEKAGISVNYFARIERGEENLSVEVLQSIAKALKVNSSDLLPF